MLEPRTHDRARVDAVARRATRHRGPRRRRAAGDISPSEAAVAALVVGERRPARRGTQPGEVAVVLLREPAPWTITIPGQGGGGRRASPRRMLGRPRQRRLRQPERVGEPIVLSDPVGTPWRGQLHCGGSVPKPSQCLSPQLSAHSRKCRGSRSRARPSTRSAAASTSAATSRSAAATWSSSPASSARRPTSTPRTTSARAPREYLRAFARAHRRLRGPLREQGGAVHRAYRLCRRRGSRSTSPPAASCTWRCAAGFDPARIHMHGNNKTDAGAPLRRSTPASAT